MGGHYTGRMVGIDETISNEMGSVCKTSYMVLAVLCLVNSHIGTCQSLLLMFVAPPTKAFSDNPYARNAQSIITEWDLTGNKSWIPGFLNSVFFIGLMVGTILVGQFSDKYGRKSIAWKAYTLVLACSFATGFCQNWLQLSVCRVINGFAVGGYSVITAVIVQEMCAARLWVVNGAMGAVYYTFSMLVYLVIAYHIPTWRALCFATALPGIFGYTFYIFLPESPRWLASQGREVEARKAVGYFIKMNAATDNELYELIANEKNDVVKSQNQSRKFSVLDLIRYPILRYRTAVLSVQWFTASFSYYTITFGAAAFNPNYYLAYAMSGVSELPGIFLGIYLMDKRWWGRRRTLVGFMLLTALSMFLMYVLLDKEGNSTYRLMISMLSKVGSCGSYNIIYTYTQELYPTVVRNVGLGSMVAFSSIGSVTAPFLANYLVISGAQGLFLSYGIICGISGVLASVLPETVGKEVPNTIDDLYEHENVQ